MCARQAGKSWANAGKLYSNAQKYKDSLNILCGLTGPAVRANFFEPIWQRLLTRYGADPRWTNKTNMQTTFPNGSRVMFMGTDDERHILNLLGNRLDGGMVIIDEAQSQWGLMKKLIGEILPPMLTPTSQICLTGTIPEAPAGEFYRIWQLGTWAAHNWGRFANIHTPEARDELARHLAISKLDESDSLIQRDYYGRLIFNLSALAFRYDEKRNGIPIAQETWNEAHDAVTRVASAEQIARCKYFSMGTDLGAYDRAVVEVSGWSDAHNELIHVYEWTTKKGRGNEWSDIREATNAAFKLFGRMPVSIDMGGNKMAAEIVTRDFGIIATNTPDKAGRKDQVTRQNDLLTRGDKKVMIGSDLADDYQKTQWDKTKLERGQWDWSNHNHPDAADASRYGDQAFFRAHIPKEPIGTPLEELLKRQEAHVVALFKPALTDYGPKTDAILGVNSSVKYGG